MIDFVPNNKRQLQKLIGYLNWYRPFVERLSQRLFNITEMLKQKNFKFNNEHKETVKGIFADIKKETLLHYPEIGPDFVLETDASDKAYAGFLRQNNKLIAMRSGKFNSAQQSYPPMERELLSILKCLIFFKNIIFNHKIIIITDNKNLIFLPNNGTTKAQRWRMILSEYDFEIKFREGKYNIGADVVSRINQIYIPNKI